MTLSPVVALATLITLRSLNGPATMPRPTIRGAFRRLRRVVSPMSSSS